jgi:hypothetical protein
MLVDGFLELYRSGILRRSVYNHARLQQLVNEGRIGEEVTPSMLEELVDAGIISNYLTEQDFILLQQFGIIRAELTYEAGSIWLDGDRSITQSNLTDSAESVDSAGTGRPFISGGSSDE